MKEGALAALAAATLFFAAARGSAQEVFSFYGLRFGMTRGEVQELFPGPKGVPLQDPGHGMSSLEFFYDREDLLMEIRAGYLRPEGNLENIGLKRALRERFVVPVTEVHPDIDVTIDEFTNRAAYTVVFQSIGIRDKNIEHYKQEFLRAME